MFFTHLREKLNIFMSERRWRVTTTSTNRSMHSTELEKGAQEEITFAIVVVVVLCFIQHLKFIFLQAKRNSQS